MHTRHTRHSIGIAAKMGALLTLIYRGRAPPVHVFRSNGRLRTIRGSVYLRYKLGEFPWWRNRSREFPSSLVTTYRNFHFRISTNGSEMFSESVIETCLNHDSIIFMNGIMIIL